LSDLLTTTARLGALDEARAVLDALDGGRPLAVVTRIDGDGAGARLFVDAAGVRGSIGAPQVDDDVVTAARAALRDDAYAADSFEIDGTRVLLQVHRAAPRLFVVGAGHISLPLVRIARIAGFAVTVMDDREDFADTRRFDDDVRVLRMNRADPFGDVTPDAGAYVVLVTRAHEHDYECLRDLLRRDATPRYVGMIGSRRRVRAAFGALLADGVPRERVAGVRAPLGLDVGAETPEEIAVSVVAEMIAVRRGAVGRDDAGVPLSSRESVLDRFFPVTP